MQPSTRPKVSAPTMLNRIYMHSTTVNVIQTERLCSGWFFSISQYEMLLNSQFAFFVFRLFNFDVNTRGEFFVFSFVGVVVDILSNYARTLLKTFQLHELGHKFVIFFRLTKVCLGWNEAIFNFDWKNIECLRVFDEKRKVDTNQYALKNFTFIYSHTNQILSILVFHFLFSLLLDIEMWKNKNRFCDFIVGRSQFIRRMAKQKEREKRRAISFNTNSCFFFSVNFQEMQ